MTNEHPKIACLCAGTLSDATGEPPALFLISLLISRLRWNSPPFLSSQVAKTEAHLQATLRPGKDDEGTLRSLPAEGKQREEVIAEARTHAKEFDSDGKTTVGGPDGVNTQANCRGSVLFEEFPRRIDMLL